MMKAVLLTLALAVGPIMPALTTRAAEVNTTYHAAYFLTAYIANDYSLAENGLTYSSARNGTYYAPTLFHIGSFDGTSLGTSVPLTLTPIAPDGKTTDRFEYEWTQPTDVSAPQFDGVEKYFGFAFKIVGPQSAAPTSDGVIIAQIWQGSPYAPPLRMDVKAPNASGEWPNRVFIQNDQTGNLSSDTPICVYNGTIRVDKWYQYVIGIKPGYANNGRADVWINGNLVGTYTGNVGYKPQSKGGAVGALNGLMIKFGIYRNRPNPPFAVAFGTIRYANTFSIAQP
jgi:hypothetical protein